MISVGALSYDPETIRLYKYGRAISLGLAPLRLLAFLMAHSERSFATDDLIVRLWGDQVLPEPKSRAVIRTQVKRIRDAIEDGTGPWLVCEGCGYGYGLWVNPPVVRAQQLAAVV